MGVLYGLPKVGKSLLVCDLFVHVAHGRPWLGQFKTSRVKILYLSREDPPWRLKERLIEINDSYSYNPLPTGIVKFVARPSLDLTDQDHIDWLAKKTKDNGIELLVLDALNRMYPGLDENSAKDMGELMNVVEKLNRDLKLAILALDHTRKPLADGKRGRAQSPLDIKGSLAKFGAADFTLGLSRANTKERLRLSASGKDIDDQDFFIDVSQRNSRKPKFTFVDDVVTVISERKKQGEKNRKKILSVLGSTWQSTAHIAKRTGLGNSTVRGHLSNLCKEGKVSKRGSTRKAEWKKK
ncbi:helicase RepA family protein [Acidobacteria bacterium AH-259-G07]|nr:helicase RepA family protein [Acidobacteria bacterium AH-259-G07]